MEDYQILVSQKEDVDKLVPLLFTIFIELLSQWTRQNQKIKGVLVSQQEHRTALITDDIWIYLGRPSASPPELLRTLREHGLLSAYKLNTNTSHMVTFNPSPPPQRDSK